MSARDACYKNLFPETIESVITLRNLILRFEIILCFVRKIFPPVTLSFSKKFLRTREIYIKKNIKILRNTLLSLDYHIFRIN